MRDLALFVLSAGPLAVAGGIAAREASVGEWAGAGDEAETTRQLVRGDEGEAEQTPAAARR